MIIVKLQGGLGNQLFQYAAGRNLAIKNNTTLKLDIHSYQNNPDRSYGLDIFNIDEHFATDAEISNLNKAGLNKLVEKLKPFASKTTIIEDNHDFNKDVLELSGNKYLIGYWQSEKYFKSIENLIRQEITLKDKLSENYSDMAIEIKSTNSISLHVRRGDYMANPKFSKIFQILDLDYYKKAIDLITEQIADPSFYVYSDDLPWAKDNLPIPHPHVFVNPDKKLKDGEELMLMSLCKHNIIANSSFSWWVAWLNQNPEKIVIAPKKWSNDNSTNTFDLLPNNWIKI